MSNLVSNLVGKQMAAGHARGGQKTLVAVLVCENLGWKSQRERKCKCAIPVIPRAKEGSETMARGRRLGGSADGRGKRSIFGTVKIQEKR